MSSSKKPRRTGSSSVGTRRHCEPPTDPGPPSRSLISPLGFGYGVSLGHGQNSRQEAHGQEEQAQALAQGEKGQEGRQEGQVDRPPGARGNRYGRNPKGPSCRLGLLLALRRLWDVRWDSNGSHRVIPNPAIPRRSAPAKHSRWPFGASLAPGGRVTVASSRLGLHWQAADRKFKGPLCTLGHA